MEESAKGFFPNLFRNIETNKHVSFYEGIQLRRRVCDSNVDVFLKAGMKFRDSETTRDPFPKSPSKASASKSWI
uniref:Uncharacterized protein n=1 Tax=Romanomermis culicivorax TaxID=13658 RepID=A0A915IHI3_ROMCU